jgi:hypothetical protein
LFTSQEPTQTVIRCDGLILGNADISDDAHAELMRSLDAQVLQRNHLQPDCTYTANLMPSTEV